MLNEMRGEEIRSRKRLLLVSSENSAQLYTESCSRLCLVTVG